MRGGEKKTRQQRTISIKVIHQVVWHSQLLEVNGLSLRLSFIQSAKFADAQHRHEQRERLVSRSDLQAASAFYKWNLTSIFSFLGYILMKLKISLILPPIIYFLSLQSRYKKGSILIYQHPVEYSGSECCFTSTGLFF